MWPPPIILMGLVWGVGEDAPYGFSDSQRPARCPLAWWLLGGFLRAQPVGRGQSSLSRVCSRILSGCTLEPLVSVSQNDEMD